MDAAMLALQQQQQQQQQQQYCGKRSQAREHAQVSSTN